MALDDKLLLVLTVRKYFGKIFRKSFFQACSIIFVHFSSKYPARPHVTPRGPTALLNIPFREVHCGQIAQTETAGCGHKYVETRGEKFIPFEAFLFVTSCASGRRE